MLYVQVLHVNLFVHPQTPWLYVIENLKLDFFFHTYMYTCIHIQTHHTYMYMYNLLSLTCQISHGYCSKFQPGMANNKNRTCEPTVISLLTYFFLHVGLLVLQSVVEGVELSRLSQSCIHCLTEH